MLLGGEATVYRGHEGFRDLLRELWGVLDETQVEFTEIRDLGDRVVATGELRTRGRASGVQTESPYGVVSDFANGRVIRVRTFLDAGEALEAAGLGD
jgi:ketosteroid isomerase-like protein